MKLNKYISQKIVLALSLLIVGVLNVQADEALPSTLQIKAQTLLLNGEGVRKKAFIPLYNAGLYLEVSSQHAAAIIAADETMAVRIAIVSGLISSKKMTKAMQQGFDQSTAGNTKALAAEIAAFHKGFSDEINKQDIFDLVYQPGIGVEVIKNGVIQVVVAGLPFKQALFGIWLSDDPVQKSLKDAMLSLE